jgi:hypothetical protein
LNRIHIDPSTAVLVIIAIIPDLYEYWLITVTIRDRRVFSTAEAVSYYLISSKENHPVEDSTAFSNRLQTHTTKLTLLGHCLADRVPSLVGT